MAERVPAGLRPQRKSVRLLTDMDGFDRTRLRVDVVHHIIEPAGKPELLSVRTDIPHVGAAAARDRPSPLHLAGGKVDDRDAAAAMRRPARRMGATIGDIQLL